MIVADIIIAICEEFDKRELRKRRAAAQAAAQTAAQAGGAGGSSGEGALQRSASGQQDGRLMCRHCCQCEFCARCPMRLEAAVEGGEETGFLK